MNKMKPKNVLNCVKRVLGYSFIVLLFAVTTTFGYLHPEKTARIGQVENYTPGLIIKFKDDVVSKNSTQFQPSTSKLSALEDLNQSYSVQAYRQFRANEISSSVSSRFQNIFILRPDQAVDLEAMARAYSEHPDIEYAEPDYMAQLHIVPSDDYYPQQWNLNNLGQWHYSILRRPGDRNDKVISSAGIYDADIDAGEVYASPPDRTVTTVVAIIDSGVDLDHPDLANSIWRNPGENPNNGLDDDHNGYIDDSYGWDFSSSEQVLEIELEDNDPTDNFGHGTHCAGIVAGITNNGVGIAGISNTCRIMALKVLPFPLTSKLASAIIYAADNGADVINMSLGYPYRSYLLEDAIKYAKGRGVVICASTGNTGIEEKNYPAGFDDVISVGASNDSDLVTYFSTFGDHVDLVGPGQSIMSLRADTTDMYGDHEPNVHIFGNIYYMASGTSMSCPHVVGAVAHIRSVAPGLHPDRVQEILQETADDITDPYDDGAALPGWDKYSGYGRISIAQALLETEIVHAKIEQPISNQIVSGQIEIWGRAYRKESLITDYSIEIGKGRLPTDWTEILRSSTWVDFDRLGEWDTEGLTGIYTLRLRVGNDNSSFQTVFVANETIARIDYPGQGDTISNFVDIFATAYSPHFRSMKLEYGFGEAPETFAKLAEVTRPIENEPVTDWLVELLEEGPYTLRMTMVDTTGVVTIDEIAVYAKSSFASENAWKTDLNRPVSMMTNFGDFNNDGTNEIVVGTDSGLQFLDFQGNNINDQFMPTDDNIYLAAPAVGDVNGDGIDDIVSFGHRPGRLLVYLSGNDTSLSIDLGRDLDPALYTRTEHEFPKVALLDIDHDEQDEILLTVSDGRLYRSYLFETDGSEYIVLDDVSEFQAADLDGDGQYELYGYDDSDDHLKQYDLHGNVVDSAYFEHDNTEFKCEGLTVYDIDGDGRHELSMYGQYLNHGYWLYVFDDGLKVKAGWPHELDIRNFLIPSVPIFVDLDEDGEPEYMTTYFGISYAYIHVWNIDGTAFVNENQNGLFARIPRPGVLNMLTVADINNDDRLDIIACANDDIFFSYRSQRIYAWDYSGALHEDFPFIINAESPFVVYSDYRFTPVLSDLDKDGRVDLTMATSDQSVIFLNFNSSGYESCKMPLPFWRYNRELNNIGEPVSCTPTDIAENGLEQLLPQSYTLLQNYPNPFNPSTIIEFALPEKALVNISVYNLLGQKVVTLLDDARVAGRHNISWDGQNNSGENVAAGVYFYQIMTDNFSETKKMVLLK